MSAARDDKAGSRRAGDGHAENGRLTFATVDPEVGLKVAFAGPRPDIVVKLRDSGLRGRGGAGFPTAVKWTLAAAARGERKYVVCNADEGEPGTFKDRVILTDYPDHVLAGMTIAARAIGSVEGIIYLRAEYAHMRPDLEAAIERRRQAGFLGPNACGFDGFSFDIRIQMGAGAYVCGEETALIESLEGQRGEPRNRPPFPVDTGFMGLPSIVNNVETLAWVTCILAKGAEWFKTIGTDRSTGLKLFSVSGDCAHPGVYEFPWGIKVGELLEAVGGADAKAVQIGGASGHCIPRSEFTRTIAFEDIPTGGSVIVFGPERDMLAAAINFLEFFVEESCGQCTPCRGGTVKLLEGAEMLAHGECSMAYLRELQGLGKTMQLASKCGLGQSAPNALLSIVQHFQAEILGRAASAAR
jgi:[NiFe] hydrogenase diaphorase moiety large subunit